MSRNPFDRIYSSAETLTEDEVVLLTKFAHGAGVRRFVVGLSGGVDSAVVLALAARTWIPVQPVFISIGSNPQDFELAMEMWRSLKGFRGVANLQVVDLTAQHESMMKALSETRYYGEMGAESVSSKVDPHGIPCQNTKSRLRMTALRYYANALPALLLGTTNYCEWVTGYFTRGGDSECDVEPIIHLYKSEVLALARHLGVPDSIVLREPTAGLYPGQTDEHDMGVTYAAIERWLDDEHERRRHLSREHVEVEPKVDALVRKTAFKRYPPPNFGGIDAGRKYDPRFELLRDEDESDKEE